MLMYYVYNYVIELDSSLYYILLGFGINVF